MWIKPVALLLLSTAVSQGAINIDLFQTLEHDRFSNDDAFIASGLDLSGVAIADTDAGGRWVSMISPNVFLSVHHASFFPANGSPVTFFNSNDPLGASTTRTVLDSQRVGTSDIRIGVLDEPLPASYAYYDFATENLETFDGPGPEDEWFTSSPYYNQDAYLFGRSPTDWADTAQDMAVGRNKLDGWVSDVEDTHDAILAGLDSSGDANFLAGEALLQVGDSGGPLIIDDGAGNLTIVGLNWFNEFGGVDLNGFSYVGDYASEIQNYLDLNSVPEVKHFALLSGILMLLFCSSSRATTQKNP